MEQQNDDLRNRFTAWMQVVVKRAKIDYIRRLKKHANEISLDNNSVAQSLVCEMQESQTTDFDFDDEILAKVFEKLSLSKRHVLTLLFVHNYTPEEVAVELRCSIQHVYNQRSVALKELREHIGGSNKNGR